MSFEEMLDGLQGPLLRHELEKLANELRNILTSLAALNEMNQNLLRTALALVREVLSGVSGSSQREDYDRRGLSGERAGHGRPYEFFGLICRGCAPLSLANSPPPALSGLIFAADAT